MQNNDDHPVIEWDQLTAEDKFKAEQLLKELNAIMDKYITEDHNSEKILPREA